MMRNKGEASVAIAGISARRPEENAGNAGGAVAVRAGWFVTLALCLGYATFAILLNSVGTAILQSTGYFHVDNRAASTLEAFKDITIAVASFTLASHLPRFGIRRSMVAALLIAGLGCIAVPLGDSFWAMRLMFFATGLGFALMKVAVYSSVGLLTGSASGHARLLGIIESAFMAAVVSSSWIFAAFIDPTDASSPSWLNTYWLLAGLCLFAAVAAAFVRIDERGLAVKQDDTAAAPRAFTAMLGLLRLRLTQVFIAAIFLYVLIEQGVGTWLPTINHRVLGLDGQIAVQAASAFAMSIALGRLVAGLLVTRVGWFPLMLGCLAGMAAILLAVPGMVGTEAHALVTSWRDIPLPALLLPAIGFFMAPIYPTLNSVILSSVPKARQPGLIGLIVVFSALGGTTGSRIVAELFSAIPDARVLYSLLVPIALLAAGVIVLKRLAEEGVPVD